jgi:hypothetical protein
MRLILLIVLLGVTITLTSNPCPVNCQCRGIVAGICTKCLDTNRDISSQCQNCLTGYSLNSANNQCIKGISSQTNTNKVCPNYCLCTGFVPWTCTRCPDTNKTIQSKCKNCTAGYILNTFTGNCVSTSSCPAGCICDGFAAGCARCSKPGFDQKTKCQKCLPNYNYSSSTMYASSQCVPICVSGCNCNQPGGCDSCKDTLAVLQTNCTTCKSGYYKNANGNCALNSSSPIAGGVTSPTDPTNVAGFQTVNSYVLSQHPELANATVTNVSTQIV